MSIDFGRTSLRKSFSEILTRRSLLRLRTNKLKGRYLFRAAVRLVLEFMEWLTREPVIEDVSDDVAAILKLTREKKVEKKALTLEDRSILLINPIERSSSDKTHIYELFKKLRAFKKYPEEQRESLADVCFYQYLPRDRVIVRQGNKAENLYFIINGEVNLTRVVTDDLTGDTKEIDMGSMHPGDMFGEIALLHMIPRTATIVTKTSVDLLLINLDDFNEILKDYLMDQWNILQDALVCFNYFETWDEETIRECCILSKLKDFQANEVLLGDGKGMVNYVHFLLEGECRLIEHILVKEKPTAHEMRYELFDSEVMSSLSELESNEKNINTDNIIKQKGSKIDDKMVNYTQIMLSKKLANKQADLERTSIVTATLVDVVNEWHEITEVAEMLMREPSVTLQRYPKDVHTIFMQVCMFYRGACFGIGEKMHNRRIVSVTPVRCFLIPRYWLMEHNQANIWHRVRLFMDSKFLSRKELFKEFINSRKWIQYKRKLVNDIIKKGRRSRNCATIYDVPYSIRITEEINSKL
ncbi:cAMP-dependent protein kinase regulatory subunit-like [Polistes fuscatus]|uniref:cAMP-dependent protein kinase regulatory subunit-like n=1 Tax=Polistes fuscatus TaxID=30207 RepID=UPI001CA943E2|nr:cAMP-dependent protein kinase regulatory subunit-like [Polistes fuscatus]